ncbi:hypothetical protein I4F81_010484 [Pyropia yezoensis]|uniref:Uncharacterized protein n=1 Tax=Pyropia yezoensis TaxID=2788 RepID=A0ACC3CDX5_PYRYE|nr:hypothetical protein I4F81_010484 [Neopyropia yezoensis]
MSATPLVTHAVIENVDGSRASVAIYAAIADDGIIAAAHATRGLELYAEAVADGGVHPNIEILQQVAAGETIVEVTPVLVPATGTPTSRGDVNEGVQVLCVEDARSKAQYTVAGGGGRGRPCRRRQSTQTT